MQHTCSPKIEELSNCLECSLLSGFHLYPCPKDHSVVNLKEYTLYTYFNICAY